jgi:hypothetical protein
MPAEKSSHVWWVLILLALGYWLVVRRRSVVETPVTWSPEISPSATTDTSTTSGAQGGYIGPYGFAKGDYSSDSLRHLAPDTIVYLNQVNWVGLDGFDSGVPLYMAWLNGLAMTGDYDGDPGVESARQQIAGRLAAWVHT